MRSTDPLSGLETTIAGRNSHITGKFATIVFLEDMTPNPSTDSLQLSQVRHAIEGAITAVERANDTNVAGSLQPQIKLLLANFGTGADFWQQAVAAIEEAQQSEHIVAVTGIGQSLDNTRAAVTALSDFGITTIGADVTADDMNKNLANEQIEDFFRVAPTNTDEVNIAVRYIERYLPHQRTMLVEDENPADSYAQTLAAAFRSKFGASVKYSEPYRSPPGPLVGATRDQYMTGQFANMHSDICAEQPDLIYFAGRGTDLWSFLEALATGGACPLPKMTVMTGDDASNIVGEPHPAGDATITVLYTALASANEWTSSPAGSAQTQIMTEEAKNYQDFVTAFTKNNAFPVADLTDGLAMMEHDAILAAAIAIRNDPDAITNPGTVAESVVELHCRLTVPGASGFIAFGPNGNPIDKVMPILQINPDGSVTQVASPQGPTGQVNYFTDTC